MVRISDKWLHSQWCIDLSGVLWVVVHKPRDGRIVIKRVGMIESVGHNSKYQVHTSADGKPHMVEAEVYRVSCDIWSTGHAIRHAEMERTRCCQEGHG